MLIKEQLGREIAQVERILQLANDSATLGAANDLAMDFMRTQKTNAISSIEVSEYLGYVSDKIRYEKKGDSRSAAAAQYWISDFLQEIQKELKEARAQLNVM